MGKVTKHAARRGKQRLGIPRKALRRMADRAWASGLRRWEVGGALGRYLDGTWQRSPSATDIAIYGGYIYVFGDARALITVFRLPTSMARMACRAEGKGERRPKGRDYEGEEDTLP